MIQFIVEDRHGKQIPVNVPVGISLSLMEVLKAADLPIMATCGGLALCATCLIEVLEGLSSLPVMQETEKDMLDTLPFSDERMRLSCQIRVTEQLNGCLFKLVEDQ